MSGSEQNDGDDVVRIGMFGGGTVGGGVYELLMGRLLAADAGCANSNTKTCIITKICVRSLDKSRDFTVDPSRTKLVTDPDEILNDDSIGLVVEVMGGTALAKKVVLDSLRKNKSVVTANKALVAEHLDEIAALVKEKEGSGVRFAYEAAVCGGIPIIAALQGGYRGDVINEVMGICNGTTNYMLGKMETGADYDEVLREAQDLGYAEADPTADVEGHDVRAKIAILARLAFGRTVPVESIPCGGITQVSSIDFEYAKLLGCTIKLVGTAARLSKFGEHDGPLSVNVSPKVVPLTHLLASARGCGNAVAVTSSNLGEASYTGPGAGRYPTANSVVADVCRVADGTCPPDPFAGPAVATMQSDGAGIDIDTDYPSAFYIRIPYQDGLGIIRRVGELAESSGVSIHSILQNPIKDRMAADFVVTTEKCRYSQVDALVRDVAAEDFARSEPLCMPLLIDY